MSRLVDWFIFLLVGMLDYEVLVKKYKDSTVLYKERLSRFVKLI